MSFYDDSEYRCEIEKSGNPLEQLYKACIKHLIEMDYEFDLKYTRKDQVVIELGKHGTIDFFKNATKENKQ